MAVVVVPAAVIAGSAAASRMEGRYAAPARLRRRVGYETCERAEATVIIVTEEGFGRVFAYPYATRDVADSYYEATLWKGLSRIMFRCEQGIILEELRRGGLHRLPYKTIRTAAVNSNLHEQVFIQDDEVGFVSYHFIHETKAFVSYESPRCANWLLDNGTPLPAKKQFEEAKFDIEKRTFHGVITWTPTTFCGDQRWEHEMVFDETFSRIVAGQIYHFTPGLTDRSSSEQVQHFETAPELGSSILRYRRLIPGRDVISEPLFDFNASEICDSQVHGSVIMAGSMFNPSASAILESEACESERRDSDESLGDCTKDE